MPSFDIANSVDMQEVDNAVNMTRKMTTTRYDFRGSKSEVSLDRKEGVIRILTEDTMKLSAIEGELSTNLSKRSISAKALDPGKVESAAGDMVRREIRIIAGIDADKAREIVKLIKGMKTKVQAKIMDDQVRVTGKKRDDLQQVIAMLKEEDLDIPLQYVNMRD
ncbi:MAG: YajQ family cyclic di-GMP-binding protein [Thermoleophilia bacterium]